MIPSHPLQPPGKDAWVSPLRALIAAGEDPEQGSGPHTRSAQDGASHGAVLQPAEEHAQTDQSPKGGADQPAAPRVLLPRLTEDSWDGLGLAHDPISAPLRVARVHQFRPAPEAPSRISILLHPVPPVSVERHHGLSPGGSGLGEPPSGAPHAPDIEIVEQGPQDQPRQREHQPDAEGAEEHIHHGSRKVQPVADHLHGQGDSRERRSPKTNQPEAFRAARLLRVETRMSSSS